MTDCHIVDHIIDVPYKGLSAVAQMSFHKGKNGRLGQGEPG